MTDLQIFSEGIKKAHNCLKLAKAKKSYYALLVKLDVREDDAFRFASNLNFSVILDSKEFDEAEKEQVAKILNPIKSIL